MLQEDPDVENEVTENWIQFKEAIFPNLFYAMNMICPL